MSDRALADIIRTDAEQVVRNVKNWSWLKDKKVLVTGGTGLIGTHLMAVLERLSHAGYVGQVSYTAQSLPETGPITVVGEFANFFECDLTFPDWLRSLPDHQDVIIHAAGYGQPAKFMHEGLKTITLNTTVTDSLHHHLTEKGRFLFISTSEIYSGNPTIPYEEHHCGITNPQHPRAAYIEGKRCGEAVCSWYNIQGGHDRIARVALAYGPGTRPDDARVVNQFIQRALTEHKIKMRDFGNAHRTYCYVSDCVEALFNIILSGKELVYNVGGHSRTTIREIAEKIAEKTDSNVEVPDLPVGEQAVIKALGGAPEDVWMSTERADKEFEKAVYVPLDEGLDRTIAYQRILYENSSNRG